MLRPNPAEKKWSFCRVSWSRGEFKIDLLKRKTPRRLFLPGLSRLRVVAAKGSWAMERDKELRRKGGFGLWVVGEAFATLGEIESSTSPVSPPSPFYPFPLFAPFLHPTSLWELATAEEAASRSREWKMRDKDDLTGLERRSPTRRLCLGRWSHVITMHMTETPQPLRYNNQHIALLRNLGARHKLRDQVLAFLTSPSTLFDEHS